MSNLTLPALNMENNNGNERSMLSVNRTSLPSIRNAPIRSDLGFVDHRRFEPEYDVQRKLGQGSYCQVYLCKHKKSRKEYAVRVSNVGGCPRRKIRQMELENRILETVQHPNIVGYEGSFTDGKRLYIVNEFCSGGDLIDLLVNVGGMIPERHVKFYMAQLILAVESFHQSGFIHRDLKPDNILVDARGNVKLTDFNLSAPLRRYTGRCGSYLWESHEMVCGMGYGKGHDLWCLGGIFYEMLMGRAPFDYDNVSNDGTRSYIRAIEYPAPKYSYQPSSTALLMNAFPDVTNREFTMANNLKISKIARNAVGKLLCPEGRRMEISDLKRHKFFRGLNWGLFVHINQGPYVPTYEVNRS